MLFPAVYTFVDPGDH